MGQKYGREKSPIDIRIRPLQAAAWRSAAWRCDGGREMVVATGKNLDEE